MYDYMMSDDISNEEPEFAVYLLNKILIFINPPSLSDLSK